MVFCSYYGHYLPSHRRRNCILRYCLRA